jgi:Protein of unknown function (DUF3987)
MVLKAGWLPKGPNGEKWGADEALVYGKTVEDLDSYCDPVTGDEERHLDWPVLGEEAYHGLAGEIVNAILPHTEADAPGVLSVLLAIVGNIIGRGAHWRVEGDVHYCKDNIVIVGESSKGRKGTTQGRVEAVISSIDENYMINNTASGLSSGEGLIHAVRDAVTKVEEDGSVTVVDPGVEDKRLLVTEPEFASPLTVMKREGNTLSMVIRNGWDDRPLRTMTRNNALLSTCSHISIIGHITKSELLKHLTEEKLGSGIANRFQFFLVRRSKALPHGGDTDPVGENLRERLKEAIEFGSEPREIPLSKEDEGGISAYELWGEVYGDLSEGREGLFGAIVSRAEAHVRRMATLYAVLDRSEEVRCAHLMAGLAVWQFAEDSARILFGNLLGDFVADEILESLRAAGPDGMTRTEISALFGRNQPARRITAVLRDLEARGLIFSKKAEHEGPGRPTEYWYAAE